MDTQIRGPNMVAETYQCSKDGCVEYGWTFKYTGDEPDPEDSTFDLVLGEYRRGDDPEQIEQHWRDTVWAATAIVNAAPKDKD